MISEYREQYFDLMLKSVKDNTGKILLAKMDNQIVGLIIGIIEEKDTIDRLTNTCPKRGIISELVVSKKARGKNIGKELMKHIENYFKELKCDFIVIDVFGPNKDAYMFYEKLGYFPRNYEVVKKI